MPPRRVTNRSKKPENHEPQLRVSLQDARTKIEERIAIGRRLLAVEITDGTILSDVKSKRYSWDEYNFSLLKQLFTNDSVADEYRGVFVGGIGLLAFESEVRFLTEDIQGEVRRLESINDRLELWGAPEEMMASSGPSAKGQEIGTKVFVVHGRDDAARETVARFLENLKLDPIILNEQANRGVSILQKLARHGQVNYAVVLLTPDDIGGLKDTDYKDLKRRARQNVVMELGYFIGTLGESRVCVLYDSTVEMPSDYRGIGYVPWDSSGGWKLLLVRELQAAGFDVDANDIV